MKDRPFPLADSLLKLDAVSFSYGHREDEDALSAVSLEIHPGESIAVLGNNGAGKSTFFLCCNGVLEPKGGSIFLKGERVSYSKRDLNRLRKAVGLVFQNPEDQIIASTVEAEVSFGPLNLGLGLSETQKQVDQALDAMELETYRNRPPHYLSCGEKKRVTIADILAMQPELIMFDEPTSSLDPLNTRRFQKTLSELCEKGMTLMVATHDIDFAYSWAERVLVFCDGELLADSTPIEVFADDVLLEAAGLAKPILYQLTEALCAHKACPMPTLPPRTIQEIPRLLEVLDL